VQLSFKRISRRWSYKVEGVFCEKKVRIFCSALNIHWTYGTTSYMICKGSESPCKGPIYISHLRHSQSAIYRWAYEWVDPSCITCVTRTGETLLNGPTSHDRNTKHNFFKPKVLCSYPRRSIMQCSMHN
jgi:hypothetical protein